MLYLTWKPAHRKTKREWGMHMLTLEKFEEASEVVKQVTQETKLVYSDYFSKNTGNKIYLKPENMQVTGAYKIRGAYYKISTLSEEERAKGLITASAGNHAQGVAYAAKAFGAKAVIVMPTTTPLIKVERTKSYGAEVILHGDVYDEACAHAYELADKHGYTFIHPFDDPAVATGQGTIAMEVIKELPLVDYVLVPIGGGGLATGVSTLVKLLNPNIKVIGVEPEGANCMQASILNGEVMTLPTVNTIADGTAVKRPGEKIFPYIQKNVDEIITVKDEELVVELDPGMAFGTGEHETTRMCIQALEKYVQKDSTVFDVGCGSGILAIAAAKLGAKLAVGVDLDPVAVESAKENVGFNNIDNIEILHGNLIEVIDGKADIVVANIIAEIICILTEDVSRVIKPNGYFITSGIIHDRVEMVTNKLEECGFEVVKVNKDGEWNCIIAKLK